MKSTTHAMSIFLAAIVVAGALVPLWPAASGDTLLDQIPDDALFCVRINQFNTALGKMDQYLAGASPVPVSLIMLVNMQLAGIVGDPMLTGIDKNGTFALVGFATDVGIEMAILAPVTSYEEFIQNPACSPGDLPQLTLLASPSSPIGTLAMMPALGGKYALVGPEFEQHTLPAIQQRLAANGTKLAARLDAEQSAQATGAAVWAFVNIDRLYEMFGPMALAGIEQFVMEIPDEALGLTDAQVVPMLTELVKLFWGQANALTLALSPEPSVLNLEFGFRAKDGTELAGMLAADPQARQGFALAGYADDAAAVNAVFKTNRPLTEKLIAKITTVMETAGTDSQELQPMIAYVKKAIQAMGDETYLSYSYGTGMPPFMMRQVQHTRDPDFFKATLHEGLEATNSLYKSMEVPASLVFEQNVESYKNISIDKFQVQFAAEDEPSDMDIMTQMWGEDGFSYYTALKDNLFFTTMGPKALEDMHKLIDAPTDSAPTGELQKAMTILGPTARQADLVASMNYINLMRGFVGMLDQTLAMMGPMSMFSTMSEALNIQTQSCMAISTTVANGKVSTRLALPKQHLIEIITVAMQIQQQMTQHMVMLPEQDGMGGGMMGGMAVEPEPRSPFAAQSPRPSIDATSPLQPWVGRAAPDIKLTDLKGNTTSIAELKGRKVIVDFWATWCPPCKDMIPDLIELRQSTSPQQLAILGISNEPADRLEKFAEEFAMNYPVIHHSGSMPDPYGKVTGLPTTFFIDTSGVIRHILVGYHDMADIKAAIDSMQ